MAHTTQPKLDAPDRIRAQTAELLATLILLSLLLITLVTRGGLAGGLLLRWSRFDQIPGMDHAL